MDVVIVFFMILLFNSLLIYTWRERTSKAPGSFLWILFVVHFLLTGVYILYASSTASDSFEYYSDSANSSEWLSFFKTGTSFISFLAWPFTRLLGLSYLSTMLIFSYVGYLAIVLLYFVAIENTPHYPVAGYFSWCEILFLLPNVHFWSSSIGKGSMILMGIGMIVFGLSRFDRRVLIIIIGSLLTFFIRPHIFFAVVIGTILGVIFTTNSMRPISRLLILVIGVLLIYFLSDEVVEYAGVGTLNIFDSEQLEIKAAKLSTSTTGVDITNVSLPFKLFTFWFRPLFIDSPGIMGFIVSIENLFYLWMAGILFYKWRNWISINGFYKVMFFTFLLGSLALAQVTGNLGIAIRQKAQLMPLFFLLFARIVSISGFEKGNILDQELVLN